MDAIGVMFGIIALGWCGSLAGKVNKLQRLLNENGIGNMDKTSLREILQKNIGKTGKIDFVEGASDYELYSKKCIIEDVDENWLLVKVEKKDVQKLVRIEAIKGVQFK